MTIQKYIENILSYFVSKFYLENNLIAAGSFENIKNKFHALTEVANEKKLAPSKKLFGDFILSLKENIKSIEGSSDRRLLRSLLALSFMIRRESNKQKSYLNVLDLEITSLTTDLELSKAKILSDKKIIILKFPRK